MSPAASATVQEPEWAAAHRETLAHLQTMIRMNTVNPPGDEMQVARFLDSTLTAAGIETHLFEPAPAAPRWWRA
jgi:acetylornithine deacetylase/succinyl-diaminopimelate desuccinylase-like protein